MRRTTTTFHSIALLLSLYAEAWSAESPVGQPQPQPLRNIQRLADTPPPQPPNYRLQPNDLVLIRVFHEDDLLTSNRVGADGTIQFPLIGRVKIGGLTVAEASGAIESLLAKSKINNPQVLMTVLELAPRRFTVLGQVQRPGTFDCPAGQDLTLLAAIGYAGGYTRIANSKKVTVKRKTGVFLIDARKMALDKDVKLFEVLPGDIITVSERVF
jgi:protein involved in polysaccharide export with SLBB domain